MRVIHLSFLLIFTFFSFTPLAQDFEGEIVFSAHHKYTDSSITSTPNLPSKIVYKISGEYVRIEQSTQLGEQIILFDTLSLMKTIIIDQNGQELAIQLKTEIDSNLTIKTTLIEDSLKIFGFTCNKILWNSYDEQSSSNSYAEIFYTNEIASGYMENFEKINGFPLKYTLVSSGIESTYESINVTRKKLNPSIFKVDNKTPKYSFDEFKSLMNE
ncbi:MAG: hypothetical protein VXY28_07525 [Bacteroidota bacterium]|nr:hypothetical protein [Bacteroidota bacterium]